MAQIEPPRSPEATALKFKWLEANWRTVVAIVLVGLTVGPILVSGLRGLFSAWYPAGDWGMIELRTLDVGTAHTPLVGPYSRYSWNHPGPLLFWFYAIPYRLTGGQPSSLLLGASLINGSAVLGSLAFAWRRGRLALLAPLAIVFCVLIHTLGPAMLRDPWNAWVTVLPLSLLIMATWAAVEGDRLALPVVALTGAFLTQSHIGFAILTGGLTLAAFIGYFKRTHDLRRWLIGAGAGIVCWLPPIVDLARGGSNVAHILSHFSSGATPAGMGRAIEITALEIGLPPPWLGAIEDVNPAGGGLRGGSASALIVPMILFLVVGLLVRRHGPRSALRLQFVVGLAALCGFVSLTRITGDIFDYLVRWWWSIGALFAAATAWSLWCAAVDQANKPLATVQERGPNRLKDHAADGLRSRNRTLKRAGVSAVLIVVALGLSKGTLTTEGGLPADDLTATLNVLSRDAVPRVPTDKSILLRCTGPLCGWEYDAMAARLTAAGVTVRAEDVDINRYKLGDFRMVAVGDPSNGDLRGLWVVSGTRIDDFRRARFGAELSAFDPLSPPERQEQNGLESKLHDIYRAAGRHELVRQMEDGISLFTDRPVPGMDAGALARYEDLRRRGQAVSVFLTDRADNEAPPRPTGW